jgi:hypothetical protein
MQSVVYARNLLARVSSKYRALRLQYARPQELIVATECAHSDLTAGQACGAEYRHFRVRVLGAASTPVGAMLLYRCKAPVRLRILPRLADAKKFVDCACHACIFPFHSKRSSSPTQDTQLSHGTFPLRPLLPHQGILDCRIGGRNP